MAKITELEKAGTDNLVVVKQKKLGIDKITWIKVKEDTIAGDDSTVRREYTILPKMLSEYIINNVNYFFIKNNPDMIYVYLDGYYKEMSESTFKGFIDGFFPFPVSGSRDVNEVFYFCKIHCKERSVDELDNEEFLINFKDGILDIRTMELLEHNPKYLMTIQIPCNYKDVEVAPDDAPVFSDYMETLTDGDGEVYNFLMEYIGVAISNIFGYRTKKALFLVGEGNTGKSQLKKIVENLIGSENVSSMDLKDINARFGTTCLYRKRLVGTNDMSFQRIDEMSVFKSITGGDNIPIEFKNKTPFNYTFKGVLWFNCNKLPLFGGDKGEWVYDRIIPIYCKNIIPKEKQNSRIFEEMWAERDTIVKWALMFLRAFLDNNYNYHVPENSNEIRKDYEKENNPLLLFVDECCEVTDEEAFPVATRTNKTTFKKAFYKWCDINNYGKGKIKIRRN